MFSTADKDNVTKVLKEQSNHFCAGGSNGVRMKTHTSLDRMAEGVQLLDHKVILH